MMSLPAPQCEGGQRTAQQGRGQRFRDCLIRGTKRDRFGPPGCVGRIRCDSDSEVRECSEQKVEVRSLGGIERKPESCVAGTRIAIGKNDRPEGVLRIQDQPSRGIPQSNRKAIERNTRRGRALRFTGIKDHLEVIEVGQSQRRRGIRVTERQFVPTGEARRTGSSARDRDPSNAGSNTTTLSRAGARRCKNECGFYRAQALAR